MRRWTPAEACYQTEAYTQIQQASQAHIPKPKHIQQALCSREDGQREPVNLQCKSHGDTALMYIIMADDFAGLFVLIPHRLLPCHAVAPLDPWLQLTAHSRMASASLDSTALKHWYAGHTNPSS